MKQHANKNLIPIISIIVIVISICSSQVRGNILAITECTECSDPCAMCCVCGAGETCSSKCTSSPGHIDYKCSCTAEESNQSSSGSLAVAWVFAIGSFLCMCVSVILCCFICIKLLSNPIFVGVIISLFVFINLIVSLCAVKGVAKITELLFGEWSSIQITSVLEIIIAPIIGIIAVIGNLYTCGLALLMVVVLLIIEIIYFPSMFEAGSIIPGVTVVSIINGIIIVLITLWQAFLIGKKTKMIMIEAGIDPRTCRKMHPQTVLINDSVDMIHYSGVPVNFNPMPVNVMPHQGPPSMPGYQYQNPPAYFPPPNSPPPYQY